MMRCRCCAQPMRPARTPLAEAPNTVLHRSRGLCTACYRRDKDFTTTTEARATLESTRASLAAYLNRRAPFRAKAAQDMTWH